MDSDATIILDTDIGYDPDDLFALLFLFKLGKISCIITANEIEPGSKRRSFLNTVMLALSDDTIPVYPGASLGVNDKFVVDGLCSSDSNTHTDNDLVALKRIINQSSKVTYIGIGGFTNIARYIATYPEDISKMKIVIMGGVLDYERYPGWIEYNIKIDPESVKTVLSVPNIDLTLVMAQTTHNPLYEVTQNSQIYKRLKASPIPAHQILAHHCDLWFERRQYKHGTLMHDPLTVSVALGFDFVELLNANISFDGTTFKHSENGASIAYSSPTSKALEFMDFLEQTLFS